MKKVKKMQDKKNIFIERENIVKEIKRLVDKSNNRNSRGNLLKQNHIDLIYRKIDRLVIKNNEIIKILNLTF